VPIAGACCRALAREWVLGRYIDMWAQSGRVRRSETSVSCCKYRCSWQGWGVAINLVTVRARPRSPAACTA
jgi:hypothetical protein